MPRMEGVSWNMCPSNHPLRCFGTLFSVCDEVFLYFCELTNHFDPTNFRRNRIYCTALFLLTIPAKNNKFQIKMHNTLAGNQNVCIHSLSVTNVRTAHLVYGPQLINEN